MNTPTNAHPHNGQGRMFTCDLCVFWQKFGTYVGGEKVAVPAGDCRLNAPQFEGDKPWPKTLDTDWCAQGMVDEEKWEKHLLELPGKIATERNEG